MKKSHKLADEFYEDQVKRLSGLAKFPHLPAAQKEIRRALRQISEYDADFIERLIDGVVDSNTSCPTPAELRQHAGEIRRRAHQSIGKSDCPQCHGSGFISITRRVNLPGVPAYDCEAAAVCSCRGDRTPPS